MAKNLYRSEVIAARKYMVPEEGVEPSQPCGYGILSQIKKGRLI